jgi:hypothetical protein
MWGQGTSWHLRATFWQLRAKQRAHLLVPVHSNRLGGLAAACSHLPSLEADGVTCASTAGTPSCPLFDFALSDLFLLLAPVFGWTFFVQRRHARVNALG